jgi:cobalt/nickel transport system permease protein
MHIPDGFIDPKISIGLIFLSAFAVFKSFSKVLNDVTHLTPEIALSAASNVAKNITFGTKRVLSKFGENKIYLMGLIGALVFAAQMFNFPVESGTSGHLIGGVFTSVLLGPFAGIIVMAVVVVVQTLFFADGGTLALGANLINMAVIASFFGFYIYHYIYKLTKREWFAIFLASWLSVVLASISTSLQLGLSGTINLSLVLPAMVKVHALIGIGEGLITLLLIDFVRRNLKIAQK